MNIILLNKKIEEIPEIAENARLYNCLKRSGINLIKDIVFTDRRKLDSTRNLGEGSKNKLYEILKKYDIALIGSEKFEKEITAYIKQMFPIEKLMVLDEEIINANIEEDLKIKLIARGFTKNIHLTTEETKSYFTAIEYYKIKLYLLSKDIITFEHPLYKYIIKQYEQEKENITTSDKYIKKDIKEIRKLQQIIDEDTNQSKEIMKEYKKEVDKYSKIKQENEDLKNEIEKLKEELKRSKTLYKELEQNRIKYLEYKKEKEELDKKLLEYFNAQKKHNKRIKK